MSDDVSLVIGGRSVSGWTSVRVTCGIERVPRDFDIGLTERFPGIPDDLVVQPGDACSLAIGGDLVVTGYIDRLMLGIGAKQHPVRVLGRGKCQDLVDCGAEWPNSQISGSSVLGIAQKLAGPYGIQVAASGDPGPVIPQFNLMYGEPAFEVIERMARYSALLAYEQADGSLLLTSVGAKKAGSGLVQGQNVQQAEVLFGMDGRYSEYEVMRQSMEVLGDTGGGGNLLSVAYDKGVPRHRRHFIICESGGSAGEDIAKRRALWEAARRAGRAHQLRIVVDSWRDGAGQLWQPNTLVPLSLPALKLESVAWLIGEVTYQRGQGGSVASLTLMPPEAFQPQPILLQPFQADVPAGVAR